MDFLPSAFSALNNYPQFIMYELAPDGGKIKKTPVHYRGLTACDAHDPKNQNDYYTIRDARKSIPPDSRLSYGVGFVLTDKDPFFLCDIDDAYDIATQKWSKTAVELRRRLSGAAVEVSVSKRGLHIIGSLSRDVVHRCKGLPGTGLDLYTSKRFVALTGIHASGDAAYDCTDALIDIAQTFFAPLDAPVKSTWTDTPCHEWRGYTDDGDLINHVLTHKSVNAAFGRSASFADLWHRNVEALTTYYPSERNAFDESAADMALACHLAYYTGLNCERIYRLMLRSHLIRDKWLKRPDYLRDTILKACARQSQVANKPTSLALQADTPLVNSGVPVTAIAPHEIAPVMATGSAYLSTASQLEYFKGCVYIQQLHKIMTPRGDLLNPEQFKAVYGGRLFVLDQAGEKTTPDAWKAYTQNQVIKFPRVAYGAFLPQRPPGEIVEKDGRLSVNTYYPIQTPCVAGDATPFTAHIAKLLPDRVDQIILTSYLAACVQYPGVKFRWCPLIQGVEGNGKTLLGRCIAECLGYAYTHSPRAQAIAARFNGWMYRKLFAWVDEVLIDDTNPEAMEALKTLLSEDHLELEPKGVDSFFGEVCTNFFLTTNHKHAVKKTKSERRLAIFFTAQQTYEDLERCGMTDGYFHNLVERWLKKDGYAIVHHYLLNYKIPDEYNPATLCARAPITSTTHEAIDATQYPYETEIRDAIIDQLPGFKNDCISSAALEKLLERAFLTRALPRRARRQFLTRLGYIVHPLLEANANRTPRPVMPDGVRITIYVKAKSHWLDIRDVDTLMEEYSRSQN